MYLLMLEISCYKNDKLRCQHFKNTIICHKNCMDNTFVNSNILKINQL